MTEFEQMKARIEETEKWANENKADYQAIIKEIERLENDVDGSYEEFIEDKNGDAIWKLTKKRRSYQEKISSVIKEISELMNKIDKEKRVNNVFTPEGEEEYYYLNTKRYDINQILK